MSPYSTILKSLAVPTVALLGVFLCCSYSQGAPTASAQNPATPSSQFNAENQDETIASLLQPTRYVRESPYGDNYETWLDHSRKLSQIWHERTTRNVAPQIIPFLDDSASTLRIQAVRALSLLEAPQAENPLQLKLDSLQNWSKQSHSFEEMALAPKTISITAIHLALGHIRARKLKGRQKLDKIAQEVGLNYEGVLKLGQKVQQRITGTDHLMRRDTGDSPAYTIVLDFVNTLYRMGKKGENTTSLNAEQLAFGPVLKLRLKAASMSSEAEAKMFLDYATDPKGGVFWEKYLLDAGPKATDLLFKRLQEILATPNKYSIESSINAKLGLNSLFRAAAASGDPRAIPTLKLFEKSSDDLIRSSAERARQQAESGVFLLL